MKTIVRHNKKIAFFLLLLMSCQLILPLRAYALTSGPSQPEMKGFEPIGNSNMVDLFSGDFTYNIPLLDVGGYPVNLAYHAGASLDDESSWVGYGWGLNVGSLNRQLRGLPDDFNGTEQQEREMSMKDKKTLEVKASGTLKALGIPVPKLNRNVKKRKLNFTSPTFSVSVKSDNYRGIGVAFGANTGLSLTSETATDKGVRYDTTSLGLSLGMSLSSFDGAGFNINKSIMSLTLDKAEKTSLSKSIGFGYNSRAGLTGMTITNSMKTDKESASRNFDINTASISFCTPSYTPTIEHPSKSHTFSFSGHLGPEIFVAFPGLGLSGTYSELHTSENFRKLPSYGSLYAEKGKDDPYALMDMNREKDIPYNKDVNYLPIPVPTYDLFTASSQDGGGQYHIYRGSSGVFFDPRTETDSKNYSAGIEVGGGAYADLGADVYYQTVTAKTQKWTDRNNVLPKLDFQGFDKNHPEYEQAYFKKVGEPVPTDRGYLNKVKSTSAIRAVLTSALTQAAEGAEMSDVMATRDGHSETPAVLKRDKREVRNTTFSYLTAKEAQNHALDKYIKDYNPDSLVINNCNTGGIRHTISRTADYRKGHHLSEITITGDDGKRSVYGIPVYNTYQEEVTFSIGSDLTKRNRGLIGYTAGTDDATSNKKGRENYYSREVTKPYATSYLLTAILSPDYIDKTGNGITDDDLGTAVKFNYSKLNSTFKWRTPFAHGQDTANYNEGFLSDQQDDKANYVYGEKEIWYLHSVESKTMVAQFVTGDRSDGLGVLNNRGGVDTTNRLKYLKEIRLYSKSDLAQHGNNPALTIPIKVVHFVYDYSICRGLPNSIGGAGKLTLTRVYFTFAQNNKGILNPYKFSYDTTNYNQYAYRQYDRWGSFKDVSKNPSGLNNSEFPYTLQNQTDANKFVSAGQLNKIELPSGGTITVQYESDDYAYVQDRRASEMFLVKGVLTGSDSIGLVNAQSIFVDLPVHVLPSELRERYFDGIDKLYFKFFMDLDGLGHREFVPGYAQIQNVIPKTLDIDGKVSTVEIQLEKQGDKNPIARAGWQFLRSSLPKYAYPGSDNSEDGGSDFVKALKAVYTALSSIKEVIQGFDKRAERNGFCNQFMPSKSWVRLCAPDKKKLGGGLRVHRVDISDNWETMSGTTGAKTATYSQVYDYTTKDNKDSVISSGVASYEPLLGSDENPFHQPISYKQKVPLGLDNFFYIEEPFGESFFPGASVGYSKVSVKSIGTGDAETVNRTGTAVTEFYTAKDYPTRVEITGLDRKKPKFSNILKLIGGISYDILGLSQGYAIELNDMHGKPKSENIYNKSGQNISSVEYFYKTANPLAEKKQLTNDVKVIDTTGFVSDALIGLDVETFTDMRQQTTNNLGVSAKFSGGLGAILIFPLPFVFPGIGANYEKISYRASSTVKIINRFSIQYKVKKVINGSSITSENLLWDAETGNVLLTKTQNEFDDPVYSFIYPAHWAYHGMGQAYENLGSFFTGLSTNTNGQITNSTYNALLTPGDELVDVNSAAHYWVINTTIGAATANRLIGEDGSLQNITADLKLLRSGRRNMANAAIATITSLNNPIVGDSLSVSSLTKILDAKATRFNEEWSMPFMDCSTVSCPKGCEISGDSTYCLPEGLRPAIPPTSSDFDSACSPSGRDFSVNGTYIYSTYNTNGTFIATPTQISTSNSFWINGPGNFTDGPLNRTAVWDCGSEVADSQWRGFTTTIQVPSTHTYYVGIGGKDQARIIVDGTTIVSQDRNLIGAQGGVWTSPSMTRTAWHIYPVTLTAGTRTVRLEGWSATGSSGAFGAEIYDNTSALIASTTFYGNLRVVFSSKDFKGRSSESGTSSYSCPIGDVLDSNNGFYGCRDSSATCAISSGTARQINPYFTGILGNWRAQSQYAYHVSRENLVGDPSKFGSTNVRKSGAYSVFNPFWSYNGTQHKWVSDPQRDYPDKKWIEANSVTYFNEKGTEVENRDALNRYSSALFGYLQSLPVAVASNAQQREIGYDGFEDYNFAVGCAQDDSCNKGHFSFKKLLGGSASLSTNYAHTGKTSLSLNGSVTMRKTVYANSSMPLYTITAGKYLLGSNELAKGFSPIPGKKYILSFWVKDGSPRNASTTVQAVVNGTSLVSSLSKWPIVEGWKRVEVPFMLPSYVSAFQLQLSSSGQVYIDDIRIHPFDAQLKTFAYDNSSQREMAELDENNFATFFEYDDEGTVVSVKKETERGIMTIKETRSSYKRN